MALQRQKYWNTRAFPAFLRERRGMPFAWGTNDCLMCAADGLLAICGGAKGSEEDAAVGFRGVYRSAEGALSRMGAVTGSVDMLDAVTFVAGRLGLQKRENALCAHPGDVVLVEDVGRLICGLVGLSGRWVHAPEDKGLGDTCITKVRHTWTY